MKIGTCIKNYFIETPSDEWNFDSFHRRVAGMLKNNKPIPSSQTTSSSQTKSSPQTTSSQTTSLQITSSKTPINSDEDDVDNKFALYDLVKLALSNLNQKVLNRSFSHSKDGRKVLERAWQAEMYHSLYECLSEDACVLPEIRKIFSDDGIIDFYIQEYQ
ncbi:15394_t:CDS:2 [Entrophospora sp. SA101]|nr:15394_t:CDS:2 [Entrophospora sp. SA101]CAJ0830892.1 6231_t:CDS:2 [Entrophospora sp. SA101]CAJ0912018.1 12220_t:CDS:2 [Entrophospora sp. SA101]